MSTPGTELSISVADYPLNGLEKFSPSELEAIAASLRVTFPENTRLVYYGPYPPSDRNLPWQKTLDDGITPIGGVKYFTSGGWTYPAGADMGGPPGATGPAGPVGPTGPVGPAGPTGAQVPIELSAPPVLGPEALRAQCIITINLPPVDGETITIGASVYTFRTTPLVTGEVAIAGSTATNLQLAVQGNALNVANASVEPFTGVFGDTVQFRAIEYGSVGNSIPLSTTSGTISVSPFEGGQDAFPGVAVDADELGQLAIVTTTNDSGTFEDVWVCSNLSPMTWQPPGNILLDRTTGIYQRHFFNSGVPSYELAYP